MKRIALLSLLALPLATSLALAAGQSTSSSTSKPATDHSQMDMSSMDMSHMDMDQNSGASSEFTALDVNKDGSLSKTELAKHRLAPHFGMLDANQDGRLSPAEFASGGGM
jgi:Ca2+-binding EF-hand superfamily protein